MVSDEKQKALDLIKIHGEIEAIRIVDNILKEMIKSDGIKRFYKQVKKEIINLIKL